MDFLSLATDILSDSASRIDLLRGGLQYQRGTWIPNSGEIGERVIETIPLLGTGSTANIIMAEREIADCLERARAWFRNPYQFVGRWIEWGVDSEPQGAGYEAYPPKRAFLFDGRLAMARTKGGPEPFPTAYLNANLMLERHPAWENVIHESFTDAEVAWGDVVDLSGEQAYMGTLPGRIARLSMNTTDALFEYWLGIREEGPGFSDFEPLLELEDGVNGTDTSDAVDATASGGDKITVSFATTATMAVRSTFELSALAKASYDHFIGRYLVLSRVKVGASTECGIRLRYGYDADADRIPCQEVYIDNTSWALVPLGEIEIPPMGYRLDMVVLLSVLDDFQLVLEAERLSGSGSLDLDCLYLIPSAHLLHARFEGSGGAGSISCNALTFPDDSQVAFGKEGGEPVASTEFTLTDWVLPLDLGFAVAAAQSLTAHDLTDVHNLSISWFPRWAMFRGV